MTMSEGAQCSAIWTTEEAAISETIPPNNSRSDSNSWNKFVVYYQVYNAVSCAQHIHRNRTIKSVTTFPSQTSSRTNTQKMNSTHHKMISDALETTVKFGRRNPLIAMCGGTFVACSAVSIHYKSKSLQCLLESQHNVSKQLSESASTCRQQLQQLDAAATKDLRARDDVTKKLELQNVEQTRSVDRLQHALRSCQISSPLSCELPGSSASSTSTQPPTVDL